MTRHPRIASQEWVHDGTVRLGEALARVDDASLGTLTCLPGWTRRHVLAHLAANADALGNLVRWAETGHVTPMYASPEDRANGIEKGLLLSAQELAARVLDSAASLHRGWDGLSEAQWVREVVTAQGRPLPASEIPWLRAREVYVHLVDLDVGYRFQDLPTDFLRALRDDVLAKRGDVPAITASLADEVAWLTGRPHQVVDAPALTPWL
ncbi:hypothetical protein GCM10009555_062120 [Acrocarpospora macrocephala]|uniref:Mycothiol-dependent maleylpyruvate isomerase metal-binding domain-containing protein n=1 Tax=Acrocarpospora macrocephala TaxID=150177 RepID=A0A5M3WKB5_9ACTN|nr:maleylpyruvate isomerase N-terminal domain-containing protein [Acrocarpospora macrocephala]GES09655.1 hypothetical protein Amac_032510 [Acrocarpospora macrocephala]